MRTLFIGRIILKFQQLPSPFAIDNWAPDFHLIMSVPSKRTTSLNPAHTKGYAMAET